MGRLNSEPAMASNMRRDAVHTQDGVFWLASVVGALLISSLVAILRSSTAEHPTVNRTVTGSNPVAGADAPSPHRLGAFC